MTNSPPDSRLVPSVLHPRALGGCFDLDDRLSRHIPPASQRRGPTSLVDLRVLRGMAMPDGRVPAFDIAAHLTLASAGALQATRTAHSATIFAPIARYTDIRRVMQVRAVPTDAAAP